MRNIPEGVCAGVTYAGWVEIFFQCHAQPSPLSFTQWCWPDGKPLLEQTAITVSIFGTFKTELLTVLRDAAKRASHGQRNSIHRPRQR